MSHWFTVLLLLVGLALPGSSTPVVGGDFEGNTFVGWRGDPNWVIDNNSAGGWYSGWRGRTYAFSGGGGESKTGRLVSDPFVLAGDGVALLIAGWADIRGATTDRWNYVRLCTVDGVELDRVYAPNTTLFTEVVLNGQSAKGQQVYLEAVDDASETSFSMLCIDDVHIITYDTSSTAATPATDMEMILQNERIRVGFDRKNGAIVRLTDLQTGVEWITEPRLSGFWRFTLPLRSDEAWSAYEANYVDSTRQSVEIVKTGTTSAVLRWKGPLKADDGKTWPVTVQVQATLQDQSLRLVMRIENNSREQIGEVWYPIVGGSMGWGHSPTERRSTLLQLPTGSSLSVSRPFQSFSNMSAFGILYPEQYYAVGESLSMPWMRFASSRNRRGLSLIVLDGSPTARLAHLEMRPGLAPARAGGNWPRVDELDGQPMGLRACFVQMPYTRPGDGFQTADVLITIGDPDWTSTVDVWRNAAPERQLTPSASSTLLRVGRVRFADLPQIALRAADAGIDTLVLSHWHEGHPSFEPFTVVDPELGDAASLATAIRQCREVGIRVLASYTLQPVAFTRPEIREALSPAVAVDRWRVPATVPVYVPRPGRNGRFGHEERARYITLAHPAAMAYFRRQAQAIARYGFDGVVLSGIQGKPMDFNPGSDLRPDAASLTGEQRIVRAISEAGRSVNDQFTIWLAEPRAWAASEGMPCLAEAPQLSPFRRAFPLWRPAVHAGSDPVQSTWSAFMSGSHLLFDETTAAQLQNGAWPSESMKPLMMMRRRLPAFVREATPDVEHRVSVPGLQAALLYHASTQMYSCVLVNSSEQPVTAESDRLPFRPSRMISASGEQSLTTPSVTVPARNVVILVP